MKRIAIESCSLSVQELAKLAEVRRRLGISQGTSGKLDVPEEAKV
jgi:hypothetical protein